MANTSTNTSASSIVVPQAWKGLETLKFETATEIGLHDYSTIDKGNLTSRQNGSVGGFMVKKMVEAYESKLVGR